MSRMLRVVVALVLAAFLAVAPGLGPAGSSWSADRGEDVELILFWGAGCPHCAAEKAWLATAVEDYPQLRVKQYEVFHDAANRAVFARSGREDARIVGLAMRDSKKRVDKITEGARMHP